MLESVLARIREACLRAGREPSSVRLVAVTKGHSSHEIRERILAADHRVLGENRIQEWRAKASELEGEEIEWHLIGSLQRNKVKFCRPFHLIHSLNSRRLADELQSFGMKHSFRFRVLVEVNVAGEDSKRGVPLDGAEELVDYARSQSQLEVSGLMTMAPWSTDPELGRSVFAGLRRLRDKLGLVELSMGMSNDFEVAVEEGATLVRIGSALFDARPEGRRP